MFWIGCCCHFERKVHLSRIGCSKLTCFNEFVLASWSLTGKPVKRLIQVNADTATHNVISCLTNTWRQLSLPRKVCNCVIRWNDIMLRDFLCRTTSKQNKTGRPWFWFKDSYSRVLLSHWSPRVWWLSGPQMVFTNSKSLIIDNNLVSLYFTKVIINFKFLLITVRYHSVANFCLNLWSWHPWNRKTKINFRILAFYELGLKCGF